MAEQVHNPRHSLRHGLRGILRRGGVAATALSVPVAALAGPSGGQVVDGQATISTPDPGTTVVDQATRNAVIDWQSFSVGSSEYVLFQQPDSSSVVLNRVIGGNASNIL
ncbi:MAG: filamentous hemagglutinin N-terminal domain-containing protein, partial [Gammaproteobacteria bacterium]